MLADLSSKALSSPCERTWERYLHVVDTWSTIPKDRLQFSASQVGWRTLVNNLGNMKCVNCDKEGQNFSVLAATRCCTDCFNARDTGPQGVDGNNPLAQCSTNWAKDEFLITPQQIKELPTMDVVDPKRAHGLGAPKVTLTLVEAARKLGIERWGSAENIEAERKKRNEGKEARYKKRLEEFEASQTSDSSSSSSSSSAALSNAKRPTQPQWLKKANWNFPALNQRYWGLVTNPDYGLIRHVISKKLSMKSTHHTFIVTDHPEDYAGHKNVTSNIFEAVNDCKSGDTILVDKRCYLPTDAQLCPVGKRTHIISEGNEEALASGCTIGGNAASNTIYLGTFNIHLKGTHRGVISNNSCCIWSVIDPRCEEKNINVMYRLTNLRIENTSDIVDEGFR